MGLRSDPIEKWKIGEYARTIVDRARGVSRGGAALLAAPGRLQESVKLQVAALKRQEVKSKLAGTPIEELRRLASGIRLGSLERGGFDTVADLHAATEHRLLAIPGVGEQTVRDVKDAAAAVVRKVESETRFRFDPDRRDDAQTSLLATLTAERHARRAAEEIRGRLARYDLQLAAQLPLAEQAARKWRMFWSGRKRKLAAMNALAQLESIVDATEARDLEWAIVEAERRADPRTYDRDELWRELEAEPAYYSTAIAELTGTDVDDFEALEDFVESELRASVDAVSLDVGMLTSTLRKYQFFGAQYVVHQGRAILGDEMGLGKTIQALAACAHLTAGGERHFMVVCPASVQANWIAEVERHSKLRAYSLHGPKREDAGSEWLQNGGVAVTTFDTVQRLHFLERGRPELAMLVVDEAHFIKNPETRRALAVVDIRKRARRTLFLTGTPMENRVEEFRNLVAYMDHRLADRIDPGETVAGAEAFRRLVAPMYLRRNQEDVLAELPERIEVEDWVRFSDADEERYRAEVRSRNLMGMRRAASATADSEKLERLAELVAAAEDDGHKVVVFSYFLEVLGAVSEQLGSLATGTITGHVSSKGRQRLIDEFARAKRPTVLLAQIEAGGVGLNIQAASVVIICEPQWKPSTEEQAIGRAHRMGQTRRVQVRRLLAKDCVDERIREVQENKQLLFEHYARRSEAKEAIDPTVDAGYARPSVLDDESIALNERVLAAERIRLGLD